MIFLDLPVPKPHRVSLCLFSFAGILGGRAGPREGHRGLGGDVHLQPPVPLPR